MTDGVDAAFLPEPWASTDLMQMCGPALLAKNGPNERNLSLQSLQNSNYFTTRLDLPPEYASQPPPPTSHPFHQRWRSVSPGSSYLFQEGEAVHNVPAPRHPLPICCFPQPLPTSTLWDAEDTVFSAAQPKISSLPPTQSYSSLKVHLLSAHFRGISLVVQGLRLPTSNAEGLGSIPCQEIKIPYAMWHGQNIN